MKEYQKIKGTQDFFGDAILKLRYIENIASSTIKHFGFQEIQTPIFENTDVFIKNVGEESDVVSKEMYTFKDKSDRSITLRPEGTAAVARSYLENKMYANSLPLTKLFYFGPMFRYERPQTGRYREFHQFGVEVYGESSPMLDCDVILSAYTIFSKLGIQNIKLKINSIGNQMSRNHYSQALKDYFQDHIHEMCTDCQRRLNTNPMRILDCKADKDNPILKNAPKIHDYLTDESKSYFDEVIHYLNQFSIPYEIDLNLVRGLDYYTDTVFEFIIESDDELNGLAMGGGGKYSDMIKSMSDRDIPGIGYAFGVERILAIMDKQNAWKELNKGVDVVIIGLDEESKLCGFHLMQELRTENLTVEMDYKNTSMKSQFKLCDKLHPSYIVIIGEEERKTNIYQVKDTSTKTQIGISRNEILTYLHTQLSIKGGN